MPIFARVRRRRSARFGEFVKVSGRHDLDEVTKSGGGTRRAQMPRLPRF